MIYSNQVCLIYHSRHRAGEQIMKFVRASLFTLSAAVFALNPANAQEVEKDIVDVAVGAGVFNTLVAAVQAADLVEVLKSDGPFTVFAPTDEAFAALPEGTVESLLLPENKPLLTSILLYHVVPGAVASGDVVNLETATTVNGAAIAIGVEDGQVLVNEAKVVQVDVMASNGIIHVIDTVILPPAPTAVEDQSWSEIKQILR